MKKKKKKQVQTGNVQDAKGPSTCCNPATGQCVPSSNVSQFLVKRSCVSFTTFLPLVTEVQLGTEILGNITAVYGQYDKFWPTWGGAV